MWRIYQLIDREKSIVLHEIFNLLIPVWKIEVITVYKSMTLIKIIMD